MVSGPMRQDARMHGRIRSENVMSVVRNSNLKSLIKTAAGILVRWLTTDFPVVA